MKTTLTEASLSSVIDGLRRLDTEGAPLHGCWPLAKSLEKLRRVRAAMVELACEIDLADRFLAAAVYDLTVQRRSARSGGSEDLSELSDELEAMTFALKQFAGMHGTFSYRGQLVEGCRPMAPSLARGVA